MHDVDEREAAMPKLPHVAFPLASTVLVLSVLFLCPTTGHAATQGRLTRWEGPDVLVPIHAPGVECFTLIARTRWERGALALGKYNVQVVLPDGRAETRSIPDQEVSARRLTVLVPSLSVRNLRPAQVNVRVSVLDAATGAPVSNVLTATIAEFPHPSPAGTTADPGPFGWGEPLSGSPGEARTLPRPGPDGLMFDRVPATDAVPGFFLATAEASNA